MTLRTLPCLALAVLLALGGLAAAGDGGDSGTHSGTGTGDPDGRNGTSPPPNSTSEHPRKTGEDTTSKAPECKACGDHAFRWIAFQVAPDHRTLTDYRVDGKPTLDRLVLDVGNGSLQTGRSGDMLVVGDADTRLRLHDNPVGQIEFKGSDGSVRLTFPAGASIRTAEPGARITYPDGRVALLVADHAAWSGHDVTLTGFFAFHVVRADGPFEGDGVADAKLRAKLQDAVESRHLGAEVSIRLRQTVEKVSYDDVDVEVPPPDAASGTIRVQLSANLTQGRTVVLHVDPALVRNSTPSRLDLRYYDVHPDGTQTEVVFARASSLQDVLDPTDDAGQPEYWVVQDPDGLQVLVSVPHWSIHAVTLSGLGELLQPSVLAGIVAGAAGTVLAGAAMFWPRRREMP
jgi:hypothetical protein